MKQKCIPVRSITYAQKAQQLLNRRGIRASISRQSGRSAYGCAWGVDVPAVQANTAFTLMANAGIPLTGEIYDLP